MLAVAATRAALVSVVGVTRGFGSGAHKAPIDFKCTLDEIDF